MGTISPDPARLRLNLASTSILAERDSETVEFFDKLPTTLAPLPPPGSRDMALQWGLDIARRAARWHSFPEIYTGVDVKSVRFAVSSQTSKLIIEVSETFGLPRRIVTGMALHYAMIDRLSPFFSEQTAALHPYKRKA